MRRGAMVTFGILGWLLAIGGGLLAGLYSSDNAACGTSAGVAVRSLSQTAQNSCVLYGTLYTLGIVLAVAGLILLVGWVVLLVVSTPAAVEPSRLDAMATGVPPPGFYDVPGQPGIGRRYWDGEHWRFEIRE